MNKETSIASKIVDKLTAAGKLFDQLPTSERS